MLITRNALDKIATEYHTNKGLPDKHIEDICQNHTYEWVIKHIGKARTVLEMGFGEGNFTSMLSRLPLSLTVVEGSPLLVERARTIYGDSVRLECELFERFIPTCKYDVIVATHVLEHVDDPVLLLNKMGGWISSHGKIIIIVPNKESLHRQLAVLMGLQPSLDTLGARDHLVGHQRVYSIETLVADVHEAGLRVVKRKGFFLKTLPNSMMLNFSEELLNSLNAVSHLVPDHLLANIGVVVSGPRGRR